MFPIPNHNVLVRSRHYNALIEIARVDRIFASILTSQQFQGSFHRPVIVVPKRSVFRTRNQLLIMADKSCDFLSVFFLELSQSVFMSINKLNALACVRSYKIVILHLQNGWIVQRMTVVVCLALRCAFDFCNFAETGSPAVKGNNFWVCVDH